MSTETQDVWCLEKYIPCGTVTLLHTKHLTNKITFSYLVKYHGGQETDIRIAEEFLRCGGGQQLIRGNIQQLRLKILSHMKK